MHRRLDSEENFQDEIDKLSSSEDDVDISDGDAAKRVMPPPTNGVALADSQKKYGALRARYKDLEMRCSSLEAIANPKKSKQTTGELAAEAHDADIKFQGRKFSFAHSLWVPDRVLLCETRPTDVPTGKLRWSSPKAIEDALTAELYDFLPPDLRAFMGSVRFKTAFQHGLQSVRSEGVSDVKRSNGVYEISWKAASAKDRFNLQECQTLICGGDGNYTKFAPILFRDPKSTNMQDFLKSETIVRVLKVLILGSSSVNEDGGSGGGRPKTKSQLWDITSATPGLIATGAVIAIFGLSGDKAFKEKGSRTSIPYRDYHTYYQQLLFESPLAPSIIKFFNDKLFLAPSASVATTTPEPDDTPLSWERRMEMLLEGESLPQPDNSETQATLMNIDESRAASVPASRPVTISSSVEPLEHLRLDDDEDDLYRDVPPPPPKPQSRTGRTRVSAATAVGGSDAPESVSTGRPKRTTRKAAKA
ncbi:hypothetical protein BJ138DRAFT_1118341 [Hygrophoropsis aurantiaca]|uniref:Uncharacterized protein n=1 Tax=Hygrophoropsis aurantiaca TaxID=72124 RepID=A0ACB7ZWX5_9AGAM|nr:hypothetical protein BJ138DRAFT_1118341 [Hygrophoropsis aurantiaca]